MTIGFFDSGIGGLTVLHEAKKVLPAARLLYYADTDHTPYGTKKKRIIKKLTIRAIQWLVDQGAEAIVVACNTATSVAIKSLRQKFSIPIIGMEPAIKPALQISDHGQVILSATQLTLKEKKLAILIDQLNAKDRVLHLSLQKLVTFAEVKNFDGPRPRHYLHQQFDSIQWEQTDALVLGCTHFIYFIPLLRKLLPDHIQIIDGNQGTVNHLLNQIPHFKSENSTSIQCFSSGRDLPIDQVQVFLDQLDNI